MNLAFMRECRIVTRATIALLLIAGSTPFSAPMYSSAAEVSATELVSGVPNSVVYAQPGQTVSFTINVAAGGQLLPGVTQATPATARLHTQYLLNTYGSSGYTLSSPCSFWAKAGDAMGTVTWNGAPTPYAVQASVYVAPSVSQGEYRIPITTYVATPIVGTQSLMLNDSYQDSFVVRVEPPADNVAPVTVSTLSGTPGAGTWFVSDVQVALAASDAGSGVALTEYSLDQGETWQQYSTPLTVAAEGANTIYYRSVDAAGNFEEYKNCRADIDKTDPAVDITTVADGSICGNATLDCAAADQLPGSGIANVEVLLDGAPVAAGAAVTAEGTHTVTAIAVDAAGRRAEHTHTFKVHAGAPEIVIVSPSAGAHRESQTFDFVVHDELGLASIDSDPQIGRIWDAEGAYTASVNAVDTAGNASSGSVDFIIDSTCPTTTADVVGTLGENGWWRSAASLRLNAGDPVSGGVASGIATTRARLDGGDWFDLTDELAIAEDGLHEVEFLSVDAAGNEEPVQLMNIDVDATPPTVEPLVVGDLGSGGYYVGPTSLAVVGADACSGIGWCEYNLDGLGWVTYTAPIGLEDGVHSVQVRAYDVAGNVSATTELSVPVDTAAPETVAQVEPPDGEGGWYTHAVQMAFSADDGVLGSGVAYTEYSLDDGKTWQPWTGEAVTITGPGEVSVQYRSGDRAGNVGAASSRVLKIDLANPTVSILGITDGARMKQALVSFSAGDVSPGSGVADAFAMLDGEFIAESELVLIEGTHVLEVTAVDGAGRTSSDSVSFVIDRSAPNIVIAAPVNGSAVRVDQVVAFSVVDDDPDVTWSSNYNNGDVLDAEGVYTVSVDAADTTGNSAQQSATCVVDRTSPVVSPELSGTPGSAGWWVSDVSVALNAFDPISGGASSGVATLRYAVDGGPLTEYAGSFLVRDGQHTIRWEAVDEAGNAVTGDLSLAIDSLEPVASSTSPAAGATYLYGQSLTLAFAASDAGSGLAGQAATFNGAPATSGQTLVMSQPGPNTLRITATDLAGNVADVSIPCSVAFNGGTWIMPAANQTTWKAGQQLKCQFDIYDFASAPTAGAVVSMVVRVNGVVFTSGTAVVRYTGGVPFYEFPIRTLKGQVGTMEIEASCNDGMTVLRKTLTLTQ